MKNTWKLAPLFVLALVMVGCGGGGSATPEGVGDSVLSAVKSERFDRIYNSYPSWTSDSLQWRKDSAKYESETTKDWWKDRKDRYASGGDNSLDPGKKLDITDADSYFDLDAATGAALMEGWYVKSHKWEKFSDRMDDMRLINVSVDHGLEGDGSGSVSYANKYGDRLTVSVRRIGGVWYASRVSLEGEEKLPTAE